MKKVFVAAVVALALAAPAQLWAEAIPSDYYVIELNGNIPSNLAATVEAAGGTLLREHSEIGIAIAHSTSPTFGAAIEANSKVKAATRDYFFSWAPDLPEIGSEIEAPAGAGHVADPTTAFFYPCQWNMRNINAPGAWALGEFGDPSAQVAVLDSGVDPFHQDLAGRVDLANSASFLSANSSPCGPVDEAFFNDFRFHGTFVASQIAGNGLGMAAVAPDSMIVGVKVLNCLGSGSFGDIIAGILYSAGLPNVSAINMSLGVPGGIPKNLPGAGRLIAALNKTVNYAASQGKLVVSAAGNSGLDMTHSGNVEFVPAESGSGISVYATAHDDSLANYSNFGISGTWVGAPGGASIDPAPQAGCTLAGSSQGGVIGACTTTSVFPSLAVCAAGNFYLINGSGTSFASPIVAGVAALVDGQSGGALNAGQLKSILKNSADDLGAPGADNTFSHGRVNAGNAVQ